MSDGLETLTKMVKVVMAYRPDRKSPQPGKAPKPAPKPPKG